MNVSFDVSGLTQEELLAAALPKKLKARIWTRIRVVSFSAERMIKLLMPVDTGRARASWGHSSAPASKGEGIWEEDKSLLTLVQGSRVEYIEALNEGHSKQAPAGFIDAEQRRAQQDLTDALGEEVEDVFK